MPGTWDENADDDSRERLAKYDGCAWYRCLVTVPRSWKGRELQLFVERLDDAHEAYFNGVKVGSAGSMARSPASSSSRASENGREESSRYTVPARIVQPGENNVVAVRVFDEKGPGGFQGPAPVLINGKSAIAMNGLWEFRTGDDTAWAKGPVKLTSTGIFWRVMPADLALQNAADPGALSPEEAARTFTVADDLEWELVLAEPVVRQPLFLNFDERGRMWVVQYIQYPYPAGLNMVSKDKFWRAVYDKVPPPPPEHFKGADKITVHEDSDGDGEFETHKTFVEGLSIVTSCCRGRGGVWVLNPPYLLFYPDRNNDDVPDGPPEVHLEGFGLEDTHSVVNSLRWGPDGWLYAAQGSTVSGHVRVLKGVGSLVSPPGDPSQKASVNEAAKKDSRPPAVHTMGQLIWRYHPEKRKYEIFAEGGGNAFGVEIDAKGRIYSGHNGGNTRGFHYVQGGYYQKGFTKHGPLSNPYAFGYFSWMKHHEVPRFTHNFVIYEGGRSPAFPKSRASGRTLPEKYHGKLFGIEPLQGRIVLAEIERDGSSFRTKDLGHPVTSSDRRFRPVDIKVGPDGAIYVCDFYEPQISHREHFSGQIDKTTGRIWRLQAKRSSVPDARSRGARNNLGGKSSRELVELLAHPHKWHRQTALRLLGDRRDREIFPLLKRNVEQPGEAPVDLQAGEIDPGQYALECLWALHQVGGLDEEFGLKILNHSDPYVRLWTVRLLCDDGKVSPSLASALRETAAAEPHVEVRSQLACSARRLPPPQSLPIVRALLERDEDLSDVHLPLLNWWVIEAAVTRASNAAGDPDMKSDPDAASVRVAAPVLDMFEDPAVWKLPMVEKHILERLMRRFAQAGTRQDLLACARLLKLSPGEAQTRILLAGFEKAFQGRALTGLPVELAKALEKAGGGSLSLRLRMGQEQALGEALKTIADPQAGLDTRIELVRTLGEVRNAGPVPHSAETSATANSTASVLLKLLVDSQDDELRKAVLTALQAFDDAKIGRAVLDVYSRLSPDVREVAQTLLVSRPAWSRAFLEAVDAGRIEKKTVPQDAVRKLTVHRDETVAALVKKHWQGVEGASNAEMQKRIARFADLLGNGSGDPWRGKQLYGQTCGKCHILFGEGGRIGPELTTYQRDDTLRFLINVVNPSAVIREGFESYLVLTDEGRVVTGFLFDQDNRVVVLRGADGQNVTIPRENIEQMLPQKKSLMPEGLLRELSEQEVRDLFAYLKSSQPLN